MIWEKIKNKLDMRTFLQESARFLLARTGYFLFVLFIFLSVYCFYLWYAFCYHPDWSAEKKDAYLKAHDSEVTFDMKKFKAIVAQKREREREYQKELDDVSDIFRLK